MTNFKRFPSITSGYVTEFNLLFRALDHVIVKSIVWSFTLNLQSQNMLSHHFHYLWKHLVYTPIQLHIKTSSEALLVGYTTLALKKYDIPGSGDAPIPYFFTIA
ncbi:hypothetical protein NPIL_675961 [Nephila pilipes]|uniref:Uncharacterized protein n=1 Tax=Nephila pilipes TaxID=299642 RepID=A0A8X6NBY3_NEPPI|nr:hypothetical protein NPIL_675961 [Nephila pilipes]